jgi:hypothetical protein
MLDIPWASSLNILPPDMSMQTRIYVDHCRVTDAVVLSMYTADSSTRLFTVPIRDLRRVAESYERERNFERGKRKRLAQHL